MEGQGISPIIIVFFWLLRWKNLRCISSLCSPWIPLWLSYTAIGRRRIRPWNGQSQRYSLHSKGCHSRENMYRTPYHRLSSEKYTAAVRTMLLLTFVDNLMEDMHFQRQVLLHYGSGTFADNQGPLTPFSQRYPARIRYAVQSSRTMLIEGQFGVRTLGIGARAESCERLPTSPREILPPCCHLRLFIRMFISPFVHSTSTFVSPTNCSQLTVEAASTPKLLSSHQKIIFIGLLLVSYYVQMSILRALGLEAMIMLEGNWTGLKCRLCRRLERILSSTTDIGVSQAAIILRLNMQCMDDDSGFC